MTRPRLLWVPFTLLALASGGVLLVHCIDGTTPNCAPLDAGCSPGTDAGVDASDAAGDANHDAKADAASSDTGNG
jgi:hypothetical protein